MGHYWMVCTYVTFDSVGAVYKQCSECTYVFHERLVVIVLLHSYACMLAIYIV